MKKTLSIFLALVLMLSFPMISFAADKNTIEAGTDYTIETVIGKQNSTRYKFTPDEDGIYKISAKILTDEKDIGRAYIDVDSADAEYETGSLVSLSLFYGDTTPDYFYMWEYDETLEASNYFIAKSGKELDVRVYNEAYIYGETVDITYSKVVLNIEKADDLREIKMNESYKISGEDEYFVLQPTEDGVYNFWSHDCYEISVIDSNGNYDNDMMFDDFPIDYTLEAKGGETYLVFASSSYYEDEDGSIKEATLNVVDGTKVSPDVIDINGADDITLIRGESDYFYVDIYPVGARYNCDDLDIKIGKERIASAEYDAESGTIIVKGKRLGKTTLTVTDPKSGVTAEVEVEVVTRLTYFVRGIFSYIYDFLESISLR